MAPIKVRVRTPARMVMVDIDDGVTIADLKKVVCIMINLHLL